MLNFRLNNLRQSRFTHDAFFVGSGVAVSQIIALAASPLLTRLFTPMDFGQLAFVMAIVNGLAVSISGRYEMAMLVPKSSIQGRHLLGIAIYSALLVAVLVAIALSLAVWRDVGFDQLAALGYWVFAIPALLFLTGLFRVLLLFCNRISRFRLIGLGKIFHSAGTVLASIVFGVLGAGYYGLIAGIFFGISCAVLFIIYRIREAMKIKAIAFGIRSKMALIYRFREFPLYGASGAFLNGITLNMPVLMLFYYFPDSIVGYFSLGQRIAYAPMNVISQAISQVNLKRVVDLAHARQDISSHILKMTAVLSAIILLPTLVLMLWAADLFAIIFGAKWYEAGQFVQILIPAMSLRFVASTLSGTIDVTNNNRYGAFWKVVSFLTTLSVFVWFAPQNDIFLLLTAYAVSDALLYVMYYLLILLAARNPKI